MSPDLRITGGDRAARRINERFLFAGRKRHIIRGDAGSPGVQAFTNYDALSGMGHWVLRADNGG